MTDTLDDVIKRVEELAKTMECYPTRPVLSVPYDRQREVSSDLSRLLTAVKAGREENERFKDALILIAAGGLSAKAHEERAEKALSALSAWEAGNG